ncbi:hypothetical protein B0B51_19480 (plasmid) [blood disease bacterium A2-HR MARDI]|uniref:Uncharacterized protein n=2 Tax=Ralstonia syzygii subsp. celebesensis TaxID=1310168 RepID=A0A1U9VP35_9RALS|nr:hypothetical protein B0B51_19480 [blood disease bacterium A2-HR MARDI]CCA82916.1 conserved hypothetical protein [blood disease bacterium R229]
MESKGHSCGKGCNGHLEEAFPTLLAALLAIPHFEIEWDGFLPASADGIAGYRADHARTNTGCGRSAHAAPATKSSCRCFGENSTNPGQPSDAGCQRRGDRHQWPPRQPAEPRTVRAWRF